MRERRPASYTHARPPIGAAPQSKKRVLGRWLSHIDMGHVMGSGTNLRPAINPFAVKVSRPPSSAQHAKHACTRRHAQGGLHVARAWGKSAEPRTNGPAQ